MRTIAAIFGLSKSTIQRIIDTQLSTISKMIYELTSSDNFNHEVSPTEFPTAKGIVDGSEFQIQKWIDDSYSGKKNNILLNTK